MDTGTVSSFKYCKHTFATKVFLFYQQYNSCVSKEQCKNPEDESIKPRGDSELIQEALAEIAECTEASLTCCHEYHVIPERTCSSYAEDGYECVDQSNCLDTFIDDIGAVINIRSTDETSNPQLAACDDTSTLLDIRGGEDNLNIIDLTNISTED